MRIHGLQGHNLFGKRISIFYFCLINHYCISQKPHQAGVKTFCELNVFFVQILVTLSRFSDARLQNNHNNTKMETQQLILLSFIFFKWSLKLPKISRKVRWVMPERETAQGSLIWILKLDISPNNRAAKRTRAHWRRLILRNRGGQGDPKLPRQSATVHKYSQ